MCSVSSSLCYMQMNCIPGINLSIRPRVAVWCQLRTALGDTAGTERVYAAGWGMVCGLSGRGPLFQGYWPTGQPGPASYWRTRNGSYSVSKFNYSKNCSLSVHWTPQTNFRIKYLKSEVLMGVRVTSCGTWRREKQLKSVPDYSRGAYILQKNLVPTSKFQTPEGWCEASSTLRVYRY